MPNVKYSGSEGKAVVGFIFTFNHAVIDGMSTMSTLRMFRVFLNSIMKGEEPDIKAFPVMHPPVEHFQERAFEALAEEEGEPKVVSKVNYVKMQFFKHQGGCQEIQPALKLSSVSGTLGAIAYT